MQLLTFLGTDRHHLGVKTERGVIDVGAAASALNAKNVPTSIHTLLLDSSELSALHVFITRALAEAGASAKPSWLLNEADLSFAPCVTHPEKIICIGLNYRRHAAETGAAEPATPVLFSKFNNTLNGHGQPVPLLPSAKTYDYEAELVVVMGKRAKHVSEAEALDYVFGYACGNDVSCRELQKMTGQWLIGKTLDKFLPVGPYLVTADEAGDPQNMPIKCWVNSKERQSSNTGDMIFSVAKVISYISQYITLEPGDLISTGTPEGVALGMKDPLWLKAGDEVVVEVGNLGRLTNTMVAG